MSLLETILKPAKFIENEVESAVNNLFERYNKKSGKDQYSLANNLALGAFIYHEFSILPKYGLSTDSFFDLACCTYILFDFYEKNIKSRKIDGGISENEELVKDPRREKIRRYTKNAGRIMLFVGANYLSEKFTGYSLFDLVITEKKNFDMSEFFGFLETGLIVLAAYTASIDKNNLKNSKTVSLFRNLKKLEVQYD